MNSRIENAPFAGPTKRAGNKTNNASAVLMTLAILFLFVACSESQEADTSLRPTTSTAGSDHVDTSSPIVTATTSPEQAVPRLQDPYLIVDARSTSDGQGTLEDPFQRPRSAFDAAIPGTTIYFRSGTYTDSEVGGNVISNSGTPEDWITLTPYPSEEVVIDAGGEWGNGFAVIGGSYISIAGFIIQGRDDSIHGSGVFAKENAHNIRITDNYIQGFGGAGISAVQSSMFHIENNTVRENASRSYFQGSGISIFEATGPVATSGPSNVIRGNYVVGNFNGVLSKIGLLTDGNCVIIDLFNNTDYQGRTLIENNVCIDNGGRGIHVFHSSFVTARNNTLIGNVRSEGLNGGKAELVAANGTDISFFNNLVINRTGIAAFHVVEASRVLFEGNLVTSGSPPPGDTNRLVDEIDVLLSVSGDDPLEAHRPTQTSAATASANNATQAPTDATGQSRPSPGAVGALEPEMRE